MKRFFILLFSLFVLCQSAYAGGPWYLRSTNEVSGTGLDGFADAKKTLAEVFAVASAGDMIYMSDNHAEAQAANITLTSPGTADNPCKVICVDDSVEPPTALVSGYATGGSISTITSSYVIAFVGYCHYYGITFASRYNIQQISSAIDSGVVFEKCNLSLIAGGSSSRIMLGASANKAHFAKLIDTDITFSNVSQAIATNQSRMHWTGGSILGTAPTYLFVSISVNGDVSASGIDLSIMGAGKYLVNFGGYERGIIQLSNCKLGSGVSTAYNFPASPGHAILYLDACDSADPSGGPRSEAYTYQGSVKTDTAVYRSGGASDGTPYSLKMTTNASGVSFISPLVTRPIHKATGTVGSAITATAEIVQAEGSITLDESECWMEVEYMGTAGSTLASFLNDHNSTLLSASTTDQTTSTETWIGLSGTPVKQKLAVTFTPQEKGFYMIRVYLARPSAVVYLDPKLTTSSMPWLFVCIVQLLKRFLRKFGAKK